MISDLIAYSHLFATYGKQAYRTGGVVRVMEKKSCCPRNSDKHYFRYLNLLTRDQVANHKKRDESEETYFRRMIRFNYYKLQLVELMDPNYQYIDDYQEPYEPPVIAEEDQVMNSSTQP